MRQVQLSKNTTDVTVDQDDDKSTKHIGHLRKGYQKSTKNRLEVV